MTKSEAMRQAKSECILIMSEGAYGVSTLGSGWCGGLTFRQAQQVRKDIILDRTLRNLGYADSQIAMLPLDVYKENFREGLSMAIDIMDVMST